MSSMVFAQIVMGIVLLLMVSGKTPLYLTAILGSALVCIIAGFPMSGTEGTTVAKLVNSGLISVIADMTGVFCFIGVMQATGFLDCIVRAVIRFGMRVGGGPGVSAAGAVMAGIIGMFTGFAPPIVTGAVAIPAAIKLGVDPNEAAGAAGHSGILGNGGGFTHPTQVALIGAAGIGFGRINVLGIIVALTVIAVATFRLYLHSKRHPLPAEELQKTLAAMDTESKGINPWIAFLLFAALVAGFITGLPIFVVGLACGTLTIILARISPSTGESYMLKGLTSMAIPLVATIGFVFMGSVINAIGLTEVVKTAIEPALSVSPLGVMLIVSVLAAGVTQSYSASVALTLPMLQVVIAAGANPLAACLCGCGCGAIMQHFLTGGPVGNLPILIPVAPGADLATANRFQRPNHLAGVLMCAILAFGVQMTGIV